MGQPRGQMAVFVGTWLLPLLAHAQELPADATPDTAPVEAASVEPAPAEPLLKLRATGFVDTRWTASYASVAKYLPSKDTPHLLNLTEGNVLLKFDWGAKGQALADLSLVWQRGWMYFGQDSTTGERIRLADHDVPALRPLAIAAELYGIWNITDRLNLTVGKKRLNWAPGMAWNPTDLLNPAKDPTDPTLQRAGAWLTRLELPLESWTLSLVAAAKTTQQYGGLPTGLVFYPDNAINKADTAAHYTVAARVYHLVAETDLNAMVYFSNLYNDVFQDKLRVAATASHVFFNALELHAEILGQTGSARMYVEGDCVRDLTAAITCVGGGRIPGGNSKVHDTDPRVKALLGARYQFGENAQVSAEYLFNGDGANASQFDALVHGLALGKQIPAGVTPPFSLVPPVSDAGTPQKFAFEPFRRHYLFLTYLHPQLRDDFTINMVVILGLQDLSGQLAPQLLWSAQEWLTLSVGGFFALPGKESLGAQVDGKGWTEYALQPTLWRAFVSARLFY